jgi:hypothetical protein
MQRWNIWKKLLAAGVQQAFPKQKFHAVGCSSKLFGKNYMMLDNLPEYLE